MGYPGDQEPPPEGGEHDPYGRPPYRGEPYGGQTMPYGGQYGSQYEGGQPPYGASHPPPPYGGQPPYGPAGPPGPQRPYGPAPAQGGSPYGPPGPYGPEQPYGGPYGPPAYGQPHQGQPPAGAGWPPAGEGHGGPGGPGGFGPQYPHYEPPRRNNLPLIIGAVVAVLILLGGGGGALYMALGNDSDDPPASPRARSTAAAPPPSASPSVSPSAAPTGNPLTRLDTRDNDPQPLTLREVFGKKRVEASGKTYTRAARKENKDCSDAVKGADLRAALRAGGCTQVLRASYVGESGKVVNTVGIANLEDADAVEKASSAAEGSDSFISPLRGSGPARKLGRGNALGAQLTRGHYLVLSWVQYADGHKPSGTEDKRLTRHDEDVFDETVLSALSYRMLTGKPLTP